MKKWIGVCNIIGKFEKMVRNFTVVSGKGFVWD